MPLNRRIVLEDSEINSAPEPQQKRANLVETPLPGGGYIVQPEMATPTTAISPKVDGEALAKAIKDNPGLAQFESFNAFWASLKTGLQENLNCKTCGSQLGFNAEFSNHTLICLGCGRVTTFELFQMEHQ